MAVVQTLHLIQARACDRWFRLQDAAGALGVSPWVISVRIKKATGRSFPQHVHDRRIQWARIWLTDRRPSCKQIAARTGYDRPADFAREFRRRLDCSPLCFRRLLQFEAGRTGSVDLAALIANRRSAALGLL